MTSEVTLERLPVVLADAVDDAIREFEADAEDQHIQSHHRWHDADLWMVYVHRPTQTQTPAFVTHRVTIGAFSDLPDRLKFIPDLVVTTPAGRFTVAESPEANGAVITLPISFLGHVLALSASSGHDDQDMEQLLDEFEHMIEPPWRLYGEREGKRLRQLTKGVIKGKLARAWEAAGALSEADAVQLIP